MPTLYIIDGYAAFFRNYHAIRTPMTSPVTKEPTNMTFGFVGMMLKLLRAEGTNINEAGGKPDYIAVALDVGGDRGTFRSQLYTPYKATRKEPPEDLEPQVKRCLAMLREVGVPIIGVEGFEADDVIATMVTTLKGSHPDLRIRMVSKDKDLKQLLEEDRVQLFDVHTDAPYSERTLMAEWGVRPDQVIDMLSLIGDTSDNVPGVAGIGEKIATQLMKDFGSLDGIIAGVDKIKGRKGECIREALPHLPLSKQLITLRRDVPFNFSLADASVPSFNLAALIPLFKELGFNRYQDDVRSLLGMARAGTGGSSGNLAAAVPAKPTTHAAPKKSNTADPMFGGLFQQPQPPGEASQVATIQAQSGEYRAVTTSAHLASLVAAMYQAEVISCLLYTSPSPRD